MADRDALAYLSGDGRTVVTAAPGHIATWDVRTRRRISTVPGPGERVMAAIAVSPDARLVLFQLPDRGLALWDIAARRMVGRPLETREQASVEFSPSGAHLTMQTTRTVQVWDTREQRLVFERPAAPRRSRESVATVSPDDRLLAVCSPRGEIELWDIPRRKRVPAPWAGEGAGDPVPASLNARFSPDSRIFALVTRDGVRRWDLTTGRELPKIAQSPLGAIGFSRDGRILVGRTPQGRSWCSVPTSRTTRCSGVP
ncbi:putative protein OS=Streptomyces rimosus subsp. rimosus (strain ATCC / DSM 40260 / JCM 4667 / NRRL 2234) OX=1265868 GN=SRIM_035400 PE=4 SV=1 [Streptomyces rimosus subsp. rimosus]